MPYGITAIHGLGPVHQTILGRHNIFNTDHLIHICSDPLHRKKIAMSTGLPEAEVRRWRDFAEILRIPGIGPGYGALLNESGVFSLGDLSRRNSKSLADRLDQASKRTDSPKSPSLKTVQRWIGDARTLIRGTAS